MLYRISVTERGLTGIANIFRSRLSRLDDLLRAGTVPLTAARAPIKFHSMSLLISIITKTAVSVGELVLFHPLREPATGVTRPSVDSPPQAGTDEAGGGAEGTASP